MRQQRILVPNPTGNRSMNASFKPRVEMLEDRQMMDAAGIHVLSLFAAKSPPDANTPINLQTICDNKGPARSQSLSGPGLFGVRADPTNAAATEHSRPFDISYDFAPASRPADAGTVIASVTDLVIDPFNSVSGRITGVVADATDDFRHDSAGTSLGEVLTLDAPPTSGGPRTTVPDLEWRYVTVRR